MLLYKIMNQHKNLQSIQSRKEINSAENFDLRFNGNIVELKKSLENYIMLYRSS
jgi:hypothetical protein